MTNWGDKIRDALKTVFEAHQEGFSGACLVRDKDGTLFSSTSGLANRDFGIPNRIDTRFDTASITKTFTAVAVLILAGEGLLHLTDRVWDIINLEGAAIPRDVTVEQLLSHTSGIADDADEEAGEDYSALFIHKPNCSVRNCADLLPQFAYKPPNFKAGTNVRYNNCAFVLLGLAIERLTRRDYRGFVTERVFKAAVMENTFFGALDEVRPNTAEGYFKLRDEGDCFVKWMKNIYSYPPIGTPDGARCLRLNTPP